MKDVPVENLLVVGFTGILIILFLEQSAYAQRHWQKCSFNNQIEDCELAGGNSSFTITYRSDGKQIEVEKVGTSYPCSDGTSHVCGKMIITERKERRTTWATYRQMPSAIIIRSSRGNMYNISY